MLKLISLFLIFSILIFLIFYKKESIFKKLNLKKMSSNQSLKKTNKSKFEKLSFNLNNSDSNDINNLSTFNKSILRREMLELFKGSKKEKIKALKIAEFLSDKSILPLLKLGLKDMDSDIIKISAKLIQKFK
tara:strand:+ start:41 stop:436 length:396 start_codon:yes stop_codon:yes gene_type:complete